MFCSTCGEDDRGGAATCSNCGAVLLPELAPLPAPTTAQVNAGWTVLAATDAVLGSIQAGICGLLCIVCIVGGFLWWPLWILALVFGLFAGGGKR